MLKNLTERQEKILDVAVKEYVNSAQPVSSQLLEKKYDFGVSPATIRNEMQKLTDGGFLSQPHTSAGRVPTDKGYRFFVNNLLKEKSLSKDLSPKVEKKPLEAMNWEGNEADDTFRFMQNLTRYLAEETRVLALNYFENEDLFWKEGWEEVLQEPEFGERENILNFANLLKSFESHIEEIKSFGGVNVYIGKENPFPKAKNFTVISSRYKLQNGQEGVISLLGPKRMAYDKNLNLINSLMKLLDNM
jgi:heat-inducible transcriptional repressor